VLSQDTDVILAALHMLDEDTPLDQRIADADALEKPQIVEKYKALLRANAALDAALQTAYSELPGQIRKRDKELGVLGRLFADLRETNEALQAQSDRNEARIAKLAVEAEAQHATRADLEAKVRAGDKRAGKLEAQVSEAQGKQKWLEGEADELHALVAKVENERARLQDENTALHTQLAEVEAERHALMTSSSWRLTGPLRAAKRLFTPSK
jgi:chromosome segregation ATPase